ncbi:MAG: adenylate/guanylate cyclase domain-containing protein [Alphaproteobacteria bacterium]|nr:adenylate/guanylate cyclase domain-containing protein [Alphaproteobacteria bacterium]
MLFGRVRQPAFIPDPGSGFLKRSWADPAALLFGKRAKPAFPERIRRDIERQQEAGEIIVGWTQVAAVVFFGLVYAVSPKAFPPGTPFEPVPWTLGIYALFNAGRLLLAYRGRLSRGFVAVSVIVDILVLMITIWSFHLQYRAPPALYLKAPTLMYVFILIALRTLRFEPGYVVLAGGCAALGWLTLFLYAVWGSDAAVFTHSYVEYVTSYKILRGAEIDKILSILVVTAILALSLVRARDLLARSVAEERAASDLSRFFAPEVAAQIRRAEEDAESMQCNGCRAAILMADLRGFTALSETLSAQELIALLAEYQSRLVPVIQRHGGSIDKYLGDGILASFGAVAPSVTFAADLCRAIDELTTTAEQWRREQERYGLPAPRVGFAGAVGDIVFGTVGHATRLEYTVIGEVVNLVAKLEKHTKNEHVRALTTGSTYALALEQGYAPSRAVEMRPGRKVEGLTEPVDLVVLAG